jgi:hypothetical protein
VHRILAICITAIGSLAIIRGIRIHRRVRVLALMAAGMGIIWGTAAWGDLLPSHAVEVSLTILGSGLMIGAHRLNHTFCADCSCTKKTS